jgi:hypothetical protein
MTVQEEAALYLQSLGGGKADTLQQPQVRVETDAKSLIEGRGANDWLYF